MKRVECNALGDPQCHLVVGRDKIHKGSRHWVDAPVASEAGSVRGQAACSTALASVLFLSLFLSLKLSFHMSDVKPLSLVFLRFLSENKIEKISDKSVCSSMQASLPSYLERTGTQIMTSCARGVSPVLIVT